jgi:hypothetical protein
MGILLTTTGTVSSITIDELGGRVFTHPVVDYDLTEEFDYDELRTADSLGAALDAGEATLKYGSGQNIDSTELPIIEPRKDLTAGEVGGGAASMVVTFASGTTKHVESGSGTYASLSHIVYGGSDAIGEITNFNINAWVTNTGSTDVRIVDLSTGLVLCELIGITSLLEKNIQSLGVISNLSAVATVLDVQGRKQTGGGASKLRIGSLEIQY